MNPHDELRQLTRRLMIKQGWTQTDLADYLGCGQQAVSAYLLGTTKRMSVETECTLVTLLRRAKLIGKSLRNRAPQTP